MRGIRNDANSFIQLDDWELDPIADYSGSDRKDGLISPDGTRYLVKYAEEHARTNHLDTSYVNNVLCEYLASNILKLAGFEVHDTFIATRNQELLVACKNFTSDEYHLIEFGRYMRKHYDSKDIGRVPDLAQLEFVFTRDPLLKKYTEELFASYWERFIGDALVGNFDRHMGNFGYLVSAKGDMKIAPVYDNGSTLFPALSEQGMKDTVLSSPKELMKRVLLYPKSALMIHGSKAGYRDLLTSGFDERVNRAVKATVPGMIERMGLIYEFIDSQFILSDIKKTFYKKILDARMEFILKPALKCCESGEYDLEARNRLESGESYTEELFEEQYNALRQSEIWQRMEALGEI